MNDKNSENIHTKKRKRRAYLTDQTLYFYNPYLRPENGFTWFKGSVAVENSGLLGKIAACDGAEAYQPNLKEAVTYFANADIGSDKEIMKLIKKWGPLGLSNITSSSLKNRLARCYIKSPQYTDDDYYALFNIDRFQVNPFNIGKKHDEDIFFSSYREPVDLIKIALANFQELTHTLALVSNTIKDSKDGVNVTGSIYNTEELTELRWANHNDGNINITLAYLPNSKRPIWSTPVSSLYEAVTTCLIWTTKEQHPIKICKNKSCNEFFWAVDNNPDPYAKMRSRTKYCSDSCGQAAAKRFDGEKRWVERRYVKQKDAGISTAKIIKAIVDEANEKNREITEVQIRELINKIEKGISSRKVRR